MDVTIVGANNVGRNIAHWLLNRGHSITIIDLNDSAARRLANELRARSRRWAAIKLGSINDSSLLDELILLAVCHAKAEDIVKHFGERLVNKIVIDISSPIDLLFNQSTTPVTSVAERLAALLPAGASLVKVYSQIFPDLMIEGRCASADCEIFIAGDNLRAKALIRRLAARAGKNIIDMGSLARARDLEGLALLSALGNLIKIRHAHQQEEQAYYDNQVNNQVTESEITPLYPYLPDFQPRNADSHI